MWSYIPLVDIWSRKNFWIRTVQRADSRCKLKRIIVPCLRNCLLSSCVMLIPPDLVGFWLLCDWWSLDSLADVVTRLRDGRYSNWVRFPADRRFISSSKRQKKLRGLFSLLIQWMPVVLSPRSKTAGAWSWPTLRLVFGLRLSGAIPSLPHMPSWREQQQQQQKQQQQQQQQQLYLCLECTRFESLPTHRLFRLMFLSFLTSTRQ